MKFKVLAAPAIMVLGLITIIWGVYPGWLDFQSKKIDLEEARTDLAKIKDKNVKAESLAKALEDKSEERESIKRYIPEKQQEEEMISTLNSLANSAGLSVYSMLITAEKISTQSAAAKAAEKNEKMVLKNFEIRIGTVGEYAKLKTFLSSAASLQRFNQVTGLKISGSDSGSAVKSDLNPNHLQVETVLEFNYAPVSLAAINANDKIFSKGEFDFSVIEKIRENMKTAINSLAIGTAGTSNPFQK